jgi:hypothetical protein
MLCGAALLLTGPVPAQNAPAAKGRPQTEQRRQQTPNDKAPAANIDLGGVTLGQAASELPAIAKKKKRKLIGPSKTMFDMEKQILAGCYVVAEGKALGGSPSIDSQTIYILNQKVVGVDLGFRRQAEYDAFVAELLAAGYTQDAQDSYVGTIPDGAFAGKSVRIKATFLDAKRAKNRQHVVQVRCLGVIEGDMAAPGEEPAAGQGAAAERAVKGAL